MSLERLVSCIGLVGSTLGIIGFLEGQIPTEPPNGVAITIKAGLPGHNNPGMEGDIAAAYAWDTNGKYLGRSDGAFLQTGDIAKLKIDSNSGGARAQYVSIAAAKNAVCVAWVAVRVFDNTLWGAWTGDIGYNCGQSWYEQVEMAGYINETSKERYIPRCTWLGEDHSNDIKSAAMKFSALAYGANVNETYKTDKACAYTKWGPDNGPIHGTPGKRAARPRLAWMEERLVVSNITRHKAENLCSSHTSWGPDFVGTDGMFCDMGTKTLTPLCSTKDVHGCINVDHGTKTVRKRSKVAKRNVETVHKSYQTIAKWD